MMVKFRKKSNQIAREFNRAKILAKEAVEKALINKKNRQIPNKER